MSITSKLARMTEADKAAALNQHPIGAQVTYWPTMCRDGRRTRTRSKAFLSASGTAVVFLKGVAGYVSVDHVEIASMTDAGSKRLDPAFEHLW